MAFTKHTLLPNVVLTLTGVVNFEVTHTEDIVYWSIGDVPTDVSSMQTTAYRERECSMELTDTVHIMAEHKSTVVVRT